MPERRPAKLRKPRLVRLHYFAWIPMLVGLWWVYATHGLPHVIWSYSFHLAGTHDRWDFGARRYTRCSFIGPYGGFTTYPTDGRCPWLVWRRASDAGGAQ